MPRISELVAYPVKSLDGVAVDRAELVPDGPLRGDRSYALVEAGVDPREASVGGGGGYVNGKSEPRIHELSASYELAGDADATPEAVTLERPDGDERRFALPEEGDALADWLGSFLGYEVDLVREESGGFPDDREARGPTVIAAATLREIAAWYDGIAGATEMRRRLRPNVVVGAEAGGVGGESGGGNGVGGESGGDAVPAFWEDRLFADRDSRVRFSLGDADLLGVNPCQRCAVPSRDPDTGAELDGFRETFLRKRRATMPEWSGGDWFDHDFRVMVNTVVPEASWGDRIAVDDSVSVGDRVDAGAGAPEN